MPAPSRNDVNADALIKQLRFMASAQIMKPQPGKAELSRSPDEAPRDSKWITRFLT
jgi:hypothetical protein